MSSRTHAGAYTRSPTLRVGSLVLEEKKEDSKNLPIRGRASDGSAERLRLELLGSRILPPFPGSLIPEVHVPAAPLLDPKDTIINWVKLLASAYRGVLFRRHNKISQFMLFGDLTRNKSYGLLLNAADLMYASEIPPASWVLFSFDVWADHQESPPTLGFVFSAMRLEQRLDWFESTRDHYSAKQLRLGDLQIDLLRDWQTMWTMLLRERPINRTELSKIVEQVFPGSSYEKRIEAAVAQSRTLQLQINRAVNRGDILWG